MIKKQILKRQNIFNIAILLLIILCLVLLSKNKTKIVYIDTNKLILSYHGTKEVQDQLNKKYADWQSKINILGSRLDSSINVFKRDSAQLSTASLQKRKQLLQQQRNQFDNYQEQIQKLAQEEDQKLKMGVLVKLNAIIKKYGQDQGYTIILGATQMSNILYGDPAVDITDRLIEIVNEEYK